jgi:HEAT repeat protein
MKKKGSRFGTMLALTAAGVMIIGGCAGQRGQRAAARGERVERAQAVDHIAASELRERALDLLVSQAQGPTAQLRANALEAMAATPVRIEPLIGPALRDENPGVRSTAAVVTGKAALMQLASAVRPLLHDPSPFVRASAVYALARCGAEVDRTPLAGLLMRDPSPRVRAHAAFLLGELGDTSALPMLKEAARASMPRASMAEVRLMQMQIAEAMVKLGDQSQIEGIRAALYPSRPEELEATALAAQILGQLRDRTVIDELVVLTALLDEQRNRMPAEVRLAAAGSLAKLGLRRGAFVADEFADHELPAVRAQAAHVYGEIGHSENLPKLEKMMHDPEGLVQVAAAAAVVRIASQPSTRAGN